MVLPTPEICAVNVPAGRVSNNAASLLAASGKAKA